MVIFLYTCNLLIFVWIQHVLDPSCLVIYPKPCYNEFCFEVVQLHLLLLLLLKSYEGSQIKNVFAEWMFKRQFFSSKISAKIFTNQVVWSRRAIKITDHINLILSTLGKIFSRRHFEIFFLFFPQKTGSDISCKLSPQETICMKCQILFFEKNKKKLSSICRLLKMPREW